MTLRAAIGGAPATPIAQTLIIMAPQIGQGLARVCVACWKRGMAEARYGRRTKTRAQSIVFFHSQHIEKGGQKMPLSKIEGVVVHPLTRYPDDRGFFEEVIRVTDPFFQEGFGQFSHSKMYPGVVKAWHIHKTQIDWWYVPLGRLRVALHDLRDGSPTRGMTQEVYLGEDGPPAVLKIPAGVAHGCRAIGETAAHLFYVTSSTYNPEEEGRIPYDDPTIGYDWVSGPPIK